MKLVTHGGFHNVRTTGDVNLVTLGGLHNARTIDL